MSEGSRSRRSATAATPRNRSTTTGRLLDRVLAFPFAQAYQSVARDTSVRVGTVGCQPHRSVPALAVLDREAAVERLLAVAAIAGQPALQVGRDLPPGPPLRTACNVSGSE